MKKRSFIGREDGVAITYVKQADSYSASATEEVRARVSEILTHIERVGDPAIRHYSRELDHWDPPTFVVDRDSTLAAADMVPVELREHIALAQDQVRNFALAQRGTMLDLEIETLPGVVLGHRHLPVRQVGSYIPGGRYPLIASAFMTVIVPKVAGVKRVVACAPPWQGSGIYPTTLYAMATSGADEIVCLGGVQALAAMAFGLVGIEPVDMIVGAGNAYVAEAKRQLFGKVGIDILAGPTEVLVIADESADPEVVATDLLGQAEHGPDSPAVLICFTKAFGDKVIHQVERLLKTWPTKEVAGEAWSNHGSVAIVDSIDEAIELSDQYAPEHLELQVEDDQLEYFCANLGNYGSLFVGFQATVAYGDKAVGTNHVLPTMGAARYTGGLWVGKFLKTCTYQRLNEHGTAQIAPTVAAISAAESMDGHALTATIRLDRIAHAQADHYD